MKKLLSLSLLALICCAAAFAAPGTVSRTVSVGAFDRLDVSVFNVEVRVGTPTGKVEIEVSEKYADKVRVGVTGRKLSIGFAPMTSFKGNSVARAVVTVSSLREIEGSSAAKISVNGPIRTDELEIDLSSAASLTIPSVIASKELEIDLSSGSSANIVKATTDGFDADIQSAANLTIGTLNARSADFDSSSASRITVSAGTADTVDFDASSASEIKAEGLKAKRGSADASSAARISCSIANPGSIHKSSGATVTNY